MLDRIANLFSREFLLSFYFPWLGFLFFNVMLFTVAGPDSLDPIALYLGLSTENQALVAGAGLLALAVLAYGLTPLIGLARAFLEGCSWPSLFASAMRAGEGEVRLRIEDKFFELDLVRRDLDPAIHTLTTDFAAARKAAAKTNDWEQRLEKASTAIRGAWTEPSLRRAAGERVAAARHLTLDAIRSSDLRNEEEEEAISAIIEKLRRTYAYLNARLEQELTQIYLLREREFPNATIAPTRLGNVAQAVHSHLITRFAMDADHFWPRLHAIIAADAKIREIIVDAKIKLDFAVVSCWLCMLLTVIWLPAFFLAWPSGPLFLLVGLAAPLAGYLFYLLAVESYRAFGDAMKSAVDLHRFDLLKALRVAAPANLKAERETWQRLQQIFAYGEAGTLDYDTKSEDSKV